MERGEFISITAASQILRVSERTTRRWCLAGKLRARKEGRAHIVDPVSVAELQAKLKADEGKKEPEPADTAPPSLKLRGTSPSPALSAPPSLPLQRTSGQPAVAEASADRPESGTKEEPADTGAALGQVKESLGPTGYQVRSLRSEVEQLAAVAEKLQEANRHLRTTIATLKYILALGAAAAVILVLGLAVLHQSRDQRILKQGQAAQAAVERRLVALEQAARPTVPVAADISPIQPTSKQAATVDSGTTVSTPPPELKPQEAKTKPKAKKSPPRATRTKRTKPKR